MNGDHNTEGAEDRQLEEIMSFVIEVRQRQRSGLRVGPVSEMLFGILPDVQNLLAACRQLDPDLRSRILVRVRFERMTPRDESTESPSSCRC